MTATPEQIAAAWDTWKARHGGKLGPGPAFAEAINAALALQPQPVAVKPDEWLTGDKLTPDEAWTILCETPDITSPEEYPDHALITLEQLRGFMERATPPDLLAEREACAEVAARAEAVCTCGTPMGIAADIRARKT